MKNLKEYDYSTPNLTPVSSNSSIASLDNEFQVSIDILNEIINEIYESKPYVKFKRSHSFDTFNFRKIPLNNTLFQRTFIERSYTNPL